MNDREQLCKELCEIRTFETGATRDSDQVMIKNKIFKIRLADERTVEVECKRVLKLYNHKFILHKAFDNTKRWCVSEYSTGLLCCEGSTMESTKEFFFNGSPSEISINQRVIFYQNKYGILNHQEMS